MRGVYGTGAVARFYDTLLEGNKAHLPKTTEEFSKPGKRAASTGFFTILLAFTMCDRVNLYGFGLPVDRHQSHYHRPRSETELKPSLEMFHSQVAEMIAVSSWAQAGEINLEECGKGQEGGVYLNNLKT